MFLNTYYFIYRCVQFTVLLKGEKSVTFEGVKCKKKWKGEAECFLFCMYVWMSIRIYEGASEVVTTWSRFLYLMVLLWWFFCVMWLYDTIFYQSTIVSMLYWQNMYCTLNLTAMNWDNSIVLWYRLL